LTIACCQKTYGKAVFIVLGVIIHIVITIKITDNMIYYYARSLGNNATKTTEKFHNKQFTVVGYRTHLQVIVIII